MYILICVRTSNEAIGRAAPPQQAGEDRRAHTHKALSLAPRDDGSPLCRRRGLGHEPVEIAAVDALDREHEDRGRGVGCISEVTRIKSTCWVAERRCAYNPTSAAYFLPPRGLPCLPTKTDKLPLGSQWLHEIKHDGFRIIARKNGAQVRLYSRPGNDLTHRFPLMVETLEHACVRALASSMARLSPAMTTALPRSISFATAAMTTARSCTPSTSSNGTATICGAIR